MIGRRRKGSSLTYEAPMLDVQEIFPAWNLFGKALEV